MTFTTKGAKALVNSANNLVIKVQNEGISKVAVSAVDAKMESVKKDVNTILIDPLSQKSIEIVGEAAGWLALSLLSVELSVADDFLELNLSDDFFTSTTKPTGTQGLTEVGRALQKHSGREGSVFEAIKFSHKTANYEEYDIFKRIINSPTQLYQAAENGGTLVFDKSTGMGFGVSRNGLFNGFRELDK